MSSIYDVLNLYNTSDKFVIQPHNGSETLLIDRQAEEISVTSDAAAISRLIVGSPPTQIYGLWGVLRLLSGPCLLVVTDRALVGVFRGHTLWRAVTIETLPYSRSALHLTRQEQIENAVYMQLLEEALRVGFPHYYFAYTMDLTRRAQRSHLDSSGIEAGSSSLISRVDERFAWNYRALGELAGLAGGRFALPIVHGFACVRAVAYQGQSFDLALVSRRSRHRAGVRYYTRGLDSAGHAANYVETEQLVATPQGELFSFVQTRGSVPLLWSQYPNLVYKPTPLVSQEWDQQLDAFLAHFNDQIFAQGYGPQVVVNLLDASGKERELCAQYSRLCTVAQSTGLRYEHFDFHRECSRARWHRLALLLERTEPDFLAMSYYRAAADGSTLRTQRSTFRVNCIDCLDRTNVAQCLLARRALASQLADLGCLQQQQNSPPLALMLDDAELEAAFKSVWSDNADALSLQYAGTCALKADYTRAGKRTLAGALRDCYLSGVRYARNNFSDGWRQDALDLLLANYRPESGCLSPGPFAEGRDWKVWLLPSVLLFGLAMLLMGMLLPPEHWTEHMIFSLFWGTSVVLATFGIFYYGEDFVDKPRLALRIGRQKRA